MIKKVLFFSFFIFNCFIGTVFAETVNKSSIQENAVQENAVSKDDLDKVILELKLEKSEQTQKLSQEIINLQKESLSNKEELYKALIETKNDRIGLLQGNISSILSVLGIIIAALALFAFWLAKKIKAATDKIQKLKEQVDDTNQKLSETQDKIDKQQSQADQIQEILEVSQQRINEKILVEFNKSGKDIPPEVQNVFNNDLKSTLIVRQPDNKSKRVNSYKDLEQFHRILLENQSFAKYSDKFELIIRINDGFSRQDVNEVLAQDIFMFIKNFSFIKGDSNIYSNIEMETLSAFPLSAKILFNILNVHSNGIFEVRSVNGQ
ncbi:hypothetical protein [Brevibacillus sp. Leaf182]|uniref:hypothetical protein n=1 Tax=Brevibacillus sp. Leaf182 TaxID=1736290 RepID=UPI0006F6A06B|nr:hypothetical protein [Brevibacillus sp. Leaf182]RAT95706.1 hypothetical protein ASG16_023200 [Brevibacillus sp. Leaf182]